MGSLALPDLGGACLHIHEAAVGHGLDAVHDEVLQHLGDLDRVGHRGLQIGRGVDAHLHVRARLGQPHRLADELGDVAGLLCTVTRF